VAQEPPLRLVARPISEDDRVWLPLFSAGDHNYWDLEATDYLRDQALPHWAAGYSTTHLFSREESPEIVGFVSACVHHWQVKRTQGVFPHWDEAIARLPDRVPVMLIPFLAISSKHQGQGYGTEIFLQLQEMIAAAPGAPRFIYLQCWEDNAGALNFWKELGFELYDVEAVDEVPYAKHPGNLLRLAFDRFLLPAKT